ncbi:hypothetical protein ACP26L_02805 [Paenibacillus sp. S-38]|uniref:hypothetical protein n=1 Tax=Paenibacillus sp. S-38 TaxID=3416710 RepID=UPI003CF64C31
MTSPVSLRYARRQPKLLPLFVAAALTAAAGCSPVSSGGSPQPSYPSPAGNRTPEARVSSAPVPPDDACADADQNRSCDDGSGSIDPAEAALFYGGAVPYYRRSSGGLAGPGSPPFQPAKPTTGSNSESKAPAPPAAAPETTKRAGTFTKSGDAAGGSAAESRSTPAPAPPAAQKGTAPGSSGNTAGADTSGTAGAGSTGSAADAGTAAKAGSAGTPVPPKSGSSGSSSISSSSGSPGSSPGGGSGSSGSRGGIGSTSSGSSS